MNSDERREPPEEPTCGDCRYFGTFVGDDGDIDACSLAVLRECELVSRECDISAEPCRSFIES